MLFEINISLLDLVFLWRFLLKEKKCLLVKHDLAKNVPSDSDNTFPLCCEGKSLQNHVSCVFVCDALMEIGLRSSA